MRLINVRTREIVYFLSSHVPPYAILSHTWEDGEVTLENCRVQPPLDQEAIDAMVERAVAKALRDALNPRQESNLDTLSRADSGLESAFDVVSLNSSFPGFSRSNTERTVSSVALGGHSTSPTKYFLPPSGHKGLDKINRCCQQALKDGLDYVWVDTCCIDKTSSTELQEAINSMFGWYEKASACYAYLSDVPPGHRLAESLLPDSAFRKSRWFRRGWTLQELLAPYNVEFYNSEWGLVTQKRRKEIQSVLFQITGVESKYYAPLGGKRSTWSAYAFISRASVAQRMSWAARRRTTREEDMVYCLLGLFDITMPMLYGEGSSKAFMRLQEAIMKATDDASIFAWGYNQWLTTIQRASRPLASSPSEFVNCGSIVEMYVGRLEGGTHFALAQRGLEIQLHVVADPNYNHIYYGILPCGLPRTPEPQSERSSQNQSQLLSQSQSFSARRKSTDKDLLIAIALLSVDGPNSISKPSFLPQYVREATFPPMLVPKSLLASSERSTILIRRGSVDFSRYRIKPSLHFPRDEDWVFVGYYPPKDGFSPQPRAPRNFKVFYRQFPGYPRAESVGNATPRVICFSRTGSSKGFVLVMMESDIHDSSSSSSEDNDEEEHPSEMVSCWVTEMDIADLMEFSQGLVKSIGDRVDLNKFQFHQMQIGDGFGVDFELGDGYKLAIGTPDTRASRIQVPVSLSKSFMNDEA